MLSLPTSILVADDGSAEADMALSTAAELARATASTLSLVHVKSLEPIVAGTTVTQTQVERLREEGEVLVERRASEISGQGIELDQALVRLGRRVEATVIRTPRSSARDCWWSGPEVGRPATDGSWGTCPCDSRVTRTVRSSSSGPRRDNKLSGAAAEISARTAVRRQPCRISSSLPWTWWSLPFS